MCCEYNANKMRHPDGTLYEVFKMCGACCERYLNHITRYGDDGNLVVSNVEYVKYYVMDLPVLPLAQQPTIQ